MQHTTTAKRLLLGCHKLRSLPASVALRTTDLIQFGLLNSISSHFKVIGDLMKEKYRNFVRGE